MVSLLGACTVPMPADVELVSVRAALPQEGVAPAALRGDSASTPPHLLEVSFASRVNLVRFVTVNDYSLGAVADFCSGPETWQPLVASGLFWQDIPLTPGGPDPIRQAKQSRDDMVTYSFFLDAEAATMRPADVCFNIAGHNEGHDYRSNTVMIPQSDIALALQK